MIATAKAERDKVVNWLALALVVDNGVDPDYAMQLGGILPDDAVIPMRGIYSTIWVSIGLGFILGAAWCGLCKINERLGAPE